MPASMISAATGGSEYVMGSSIAIVGTGPTPGSTPTSVPRSTPMKQYRMFWKVTATERPRTRWSISSMRLPHQGRRPCRKLQAQPVAKREDDEGRQRDRCDHRFQPSVLVARGAGQQHEQDQIGRAHV